MTTQQAGPIVVRRADPAVEGTVEDGFEPVVDEFVRNFAERGETAAALCVYHRGTPVVELYGGGYRPENLQVTRSITKGVLAILAHLAHQRGDLDIDRPVADVWPEFAANGKSDVLIRWVLSHQSGLPCVDKRLSPAQALRWRPAIDGLEQQVPVWTPGQGHGYHDLTFGWLVGEVLRRTTGHKVGELVQRDLAGPLGIDYWVGLPPAQMRRLLPIRYAPGGNRLNRLPPKASAEVASLLSRTAANPDFYPWEHRPEYLAGEVPATNGVGDARGLARLYASLIGEVDGVRLFRPETLAEACGERAAGPDLVVGWDRRYSTGFMLTDPNRPMGGLDTPSFGYYGQGGSLTFADPSAELAFAYLSVQEQLHLGPDPRTSQVAAAARACATG